MPSRTPPTTPPTTTKNGELAAQLAALELTRTAEDLDDPDLPYWAIDPSRARRAAHRLVMAASQLEARIQEYLTALDLDRQIDAGRPDDDLPF